MPVNPSIPITGTPVAALEIQQNFAAAATDITTLNTTKQNTLVSGSTIRTVNGNSLLGAGDLTIAGGGGTWGSITGTLTSQTDLNTALNARAPLASPTLTGVPSAPTATAGTNTTQLATTAFVTAAVTAATAGVSSFNTRTGAVTLTLLDVTGVGGAPLASPTFTGTPAGPTAAVGTNTTQLATTAFVISAVSAATAGVSSFNTRTGAVTLTLADVTTVGGAPLAGPTFTGVPAAPTAAAGTNTTQLATTAFVTAAVGAGGGGISALTGDVAASGTGSVTSTVERIRNRNVSASAPTDGQVLQWNQGGNQWQPGTVAAGGGITALTGDVTASGTGSVAANVVRLQGRNVAATAPSGGEVLAWNAVGSQWQPTPAAAVPGPVIVPVASTTGSAAAFPMGTLRISDMDGSLWFSDGNAWNPF